MQLQWLDVLILVTSVVGVTAFGMWIGRKEDNTKDHYLAGKTVARCADSSGSHQKDRWRA